MRKYKIESSREEFSPEESEAEWVSIKGGKGGGKEGVEDETAEKARIQHLVFRLFSRLHFFKISTGFGHLLGTEIRDELVRVWAQNERESYIFR